MLHIICFGNPWQGDDGFGTHVLRQLRERRGLPRRVKVFDAGIAGLAAVGYFEGCRKAVIVDAMRTGGPVGCVRRLRPRDLRPPGAELSLHAFGVEQLLTALPATLGAREMPEVVLIGAEIGEVRRFGDELTPPLRAAIGRAVRLVRREIIGRATGRFIGLPERVNSERVRPLVGNDGDDVVGGGVDRDVAIGGKGSDLVASGGGDDILIGCTTDYDTNVAALQAILNEWASTNGYSDRQSNLRGTTDGLNGI